MKSVGGKSSVSLQNQHQEMHKAKATVPTVGAHTADGLVEYFGVGYGVHAPYI
jgi:hypothetical protein